MVLRKILQIVIQLPVWLLILHDSVGIAYDTNYFHIITYLGIVFSILSLAFPKKWSMGLNDYLNASIVEKISPLVFSIGMLLLVGRLTPTYTVAIVSTFFFANTLSYLAFLISDIVRIKVSRFLRQKKEG